MTRSIRTGAGHGQGMQVLVLFLAILTPQICSNTIMPPTSCKPGCARLRGGAQASSEPGHAGAAVEFREEGRALLAAGDKTAAFAMYQKAIEIAPSDAESLTALGRLTDQVLDNQQDAFDLFVRAAHAAPDDPVVLSNYAFALENWCDRLQLAEVCPLWLLPLFAAVFKPARDAGADAPRCAHAVCPPHMRERECAGAPS
jgi:tetratricopeptide (TPR) repeat protein